MRETPIMRLTMIALSAIGSRVFRQNTGMGWVGKVARKTKDEITLRNYRPLHAGMCVGSSDIIGWTPVVITPEMVGRTVAVFTAIESKGEGGGASDEQENFIARISEAGGIAAVAFTPEEAVAAVTAYRGSAT